MTRDLLIGGVIVLLAALGIGGVFLFSMREVTDAPKTIKPRTEPIAKIQEKDPEPAPADAVRKIPIKKADPGPIVAKKIEPKKKDDPPREIAKVEPKGKQDPPKEIAKVEPKVEVKKEPLVRKVPAVIVFGDRIKLNDPEGEYVVKTLHSTQVILIGKIKTLKVAGADGASVLDATGLEAEEIFFTGDINGQSKVLLSAPKGLVQFQREINGRSHIEVIAPEGKVIFKSTHASIINGESNLKIVAKDVLLLGDINGTRTTVDVTLTREGSLKFLRIIGQVQLNYARANASDPEPRIDKGIIGPAARLNRK